MEASGGGFGRPSQMMEGSWAIAGFLALALDWRWNVLGNCELRSIRL